MISLVTGATSGIGKEIAARLAVLGHTVLIPARTAARGEQAAADIRRRAPGAQIDVFVADLSDLASVRSLAAAVTGRHDRLDVLVNNAGVIRTGRVPTPAGLDTTLAVNHLAPFLLTDLLRDRLAHSAPARVLTVASAAHKQVRKIPWDDLGNGNYALSKLLNVLFTRELARRLAGTGVTANCLHPGFVRTGLGRDVTGVTGALVRLILPFQAGPALAAAAAVHLATAPSLDGVTGGYFVKGEQVEPSALARDDAAAARLWALSEELTR